MSSAGDETVTISSRPADKRAITVAALLRALLLATFGLALIGTRAADAFTISGVVTQYFADGRAVAGAQITASECVDGLQVASAMSDIAGFYSLSLPAGTYDLAVTPPFNSVDLGFTYKSQSVTADRTLNFELGPHGDPAAFLPAIDRISALRISPGVLVAAESGLPAVSAGSCKTGAIVSYSGTRPATTTFTVQRPVPGRRAGRSCVTSSERTRNGARCKLYINVGSFKHADALGVNQFRFTGRIHARKLRPGQYRLNAVSRNVVGSGAVVATTFRITK